MDIFSIDLATQETVIAIFSPECQKVTTDTLSSCRNPSLQGIFHQNRMNGS